MLSLLSYSSTLNIQTYNKRIAPIDRLMRAIMLSRWPEQSYYWLKLPVVWLWSHPGSNNPQSSEDGFGPGRAWMRCLLRSRRLALVAVSFLERNKGFFGVYAAPSARLQLRWVCGGGLARSLSALTNACVLQFRQPGRFCTDTTP